MLHSLFASAYIIFSFLFRWLHSDLHRSPCSSNFASVCWSTKKTKIRFVQPILRIQPEKVEYWESHIEVTPFRISDFCKNLHLSRNGRSIWRKWFVSLDEAGKHRRESTMFTIACVIGIAKTFVLRISKSSPWEKWFGRRNCWIHTARTLHHLRSLTY